MSYKYQYHKISTIVLCAYFYVHVHMLFNTFFYLHFLLQARVYVYVYMCVCVCVCVCVYMCVFAACQAAQSLLVMEFQHVLNVVSIKQVVDQLAHYYPYNVNTLTLKPVSIM